MVLEKELLVMYNQFRDLYTTIEHEHTRFKGYALQIQPHIPYLDKKTLKEIDVYLESYRDNIKKQLDVLLSDPTIKPYIPRWLMKKVHAYRVDVDKILGEAKLALSECSTKH